MIKSFQIFKQKHIDTPILRIVKEIGKPYDQITELDCYNKQLTSLKGIENLVNLEKLICSNNPLTSLKGIEKLVDPRYLDCANIGVELVNLKTLWCQNNKFSDDYKKYIRSLKIKDLRI